MIHRFLVLALSASFLACSLACGPLLVMPGGALEGQAEPTPSDWVWTDEVSTIQLETRPSDPYSVNIWVIAIGDNLYVHAGANRSTWIENMEVDPAVRIQIDGRVFELAASRVGEQSEFDAFSNAYEAKYSARPRNESVSEAYLFRLAAR